FGQQRLLLIVRALVKNPPLLILDEPLQGLDGYARALVKSFISYVMQNGKTSILFVSHHQEDLPEGFTNRLTFVPDGDNFKVVQEKLN
ncbi:MAG: molybdate ABC transporter ATP-binding protein ModF, partial [Succinivibrio sp.]|nr:molybdate ABC transporter ATP-binding protein ModF [Succinivibrio sp.]